ncbi:hypothetical protein [Sphingobacterium faecale]|uniref:Uncharacterized protein n=1 Tax=Sphingobacterium faecale TaxID=2803775 RepID=A0ABS1R8S8_9SPHI|nr:hypothetical protein [Sphingobacterium faecale]MBL1411078.1 hypothetical protein [Sphingobacterium faecale]
MILKEIKENELYLYINGELVYKRWLDTGQSKVFDVMAYDKYTLSSISTPAPTDTLLIVKANIRLKPTEEGGRKTGVISGYRPNHVFEYGAEGNIVQTYIGDLVFGDENLLMPGEERIVTVRFIPSADLEKYLTKGRKWWLHEGPNLIGEAVIL